MKTTKDNVAAVREQMEQTKADQPKRAAQKQAEKTAKQKAGRNGAGNRVGAGQWKNQVCGMPLPAVFQYKS